MLSRTFSSSHFFTIAANSRSSGSKTESDPRMSSGLSGLVITVSLAVDCPYSPPSPAGTPRAEPQGHPRAEPYGAGRAPPTPVQALPRDARHRPQQGRRVPRPGGPRAPNHRWPATLAGRLSGHVPENFGIIGWRE